MTGHFWLHPDAAEESVIARCWRCEAEEWSAHDHLVMWGVR